MKFSVNVKDTIEELEKEHGRLSEGNRGILSEFLDLANKAYYQGRSDEAMNRD